MKDCWVWLYRGAWQEWGIDEIEMAVPMSPDQVLEKRKGILSTNHKKMELFFKVPTVESFGNVQKIEIKKLLVYMMN